MAGQYRFSREARLLGAKDYRAVFNARQRLRSHNFALHCRVSDCSARLGLIVGKRYLPYATERNRIKRLARESFRQMRSALPQLDMVLHLQKTPDLTGLPDGKQRQRLSREITDLLQSSCERW